MADMMSPAAWVEYLEAKLENRRPAVQHYVDYREGNHRLAFATAKYKESFGRLLGPFADNWCKPVVEVAVERLRVQGMDFGSDDDSNEAWSIWQANNLDAWSTMAHREAITCGEAYTLTAPAGPGMAPRITIEHPLQVIVEYGEDDPNVRVAALKKWLGRDGYLRATLYLPDWIHRFRSKEKARRGGRVQWVRLDGDGIIPNPMGVVPVVPLRNNPTLLGGGQSDLDGVDALNDAINKLVLDMMISSEFAAFPQKIIAGIEVPNDPLTGKPITGAFEMGASRLLTVAAKDGVQWGQFQPADLKNYVNAIDMLLQHLAAQSRTPPHYLIGQIVNASGDSLEAAEAGLEEKAHDKTVTFGDGWEETMRVAFRARNAPGDLTRAENMAAETRWKNPGRRTEAQILDAAIKRITAKVPFEQVWLDMGYTPQQVQDFHKKLGLPVREGGTLDQMPTTATVREAVAPVDSVSQTGA